MVDANVGALKLDNSDLHAVGDVPLGLGQRSWGAVGWGSGSANAHVTDQVESDTTKMKAPAKLAHPR